MNRRHARPVRQPARRMWLMLAVVLAVVVLYSGKLVQIQAVDASVLAQEALRERMVTRDVPALRGDVLDRNGQVLATSARSVTLIGDQTLAADYVDRDDPRRAGARAVAARLAPILNRPVSEITQRLTGDSKYVVVARDVPPETWRRIRDLRMGMIVTPEASSRREYPAGSVAGPLVGFVNSEGTGLAGVELAQQDALTGEDGWLQYERGGSGAYPGIPGGITDQQEAVDGDDVVLTIDRDLQWLAEEALAEAVVQSGARSGTAVVMDARTSELIALATVPGFDPGEAGRTAGERLGNGAVSEVFEPGSTGKVMTLAAAIEDGRVTPTSRFTVADTIERADRRFKDSHSHETLQLTLAGVLAESSNVGTILASDGMTSQELHDWFSRFGLGERTGVGLPGESPGILAPADDWSGSQRYTVAFGQGLSVTALQMAGVYQTLANDGIRVPPSVVRGRTTAAGHWVPASPPRPEQVLSPQTAATMTRMLESVVGAGGTGEEAAVPGYRVAGKTGTAQRYDDACGCYQGYTASFAGYAPAEDPRIVVSVAVQDPTDGIFGGVTAAPVFSKIMGAALAAEHVATSTTTPTPYPLEW